MRIEPSTVPKFMPGVRLQYSEARQQWIVQAPERVLMPDETAVAVLRRCDGRTTVAAIGETLAREYEAPPEVVTGDVIEMLQDLTDKGVITDGRP